MAYSLKSGVENEHMDNTQRGLLVGLPAIALALSFGAAHHTAKSPAAQPAKTIPVVATLGAGESGAKKPGSGTGGSTNGTSIVPQGLSSYSYSGPGYMTSSPSGGSAIASGSSGSGGTGGIVGGMGGGPTGGSGGTSGGGTTTLPTCSLDQIATVDCLVTACSPTVNLTPGQKAILGLDGACVIVN